MAQKNIAYGRALYYPHINFQNERWAKNAALYYKGLDRIVPAGVTPTEDVEIIRRLNDEEQFTREIDPKYAADMIAYDFLEFAQQNLAKRSERKKILEKIGHVVKSNEPFSIHGKKMAYMLQHALPKLGLAKPNKQLSQSDWFEFDPITGAIYMTFLASHLAERARIPVVTDNTIFQPFIGGMENIQTDTTNDVGYTLASMVIKSAVPLDVASIPAPKIIEFRKKYDDERHLFYNEINRLVKDVEGVESEDALKGILEARKKDIAIATKNIERAFTGMKIATGTALLGLSVPAFASWIGAGYAAAGIITVATAKTLQQGNEYYRNKKNSPYSYVLALRKNLKAETFAQQMLRGKVIF